MKKDERLFKKFGRVFPGGTVLFEEGQTCTGMFIIQKGRVRLYRKTGRKETTIDVLGEGDFFGEMACLMEQPRSVNAVVEEESQILVIEPPVLDSLIRGNSGIGFKILGNLASRLRKAYEIIGRLNEELEKTMSKGSSIT